MYWTPPERASMSGCAYRTPTGTTPPWPSPTTRARAPPSSRRP